MTTDEIQMTLVVARNSQSLLVQQNEQVVTIATFKLFY